MKLKAYEILEKSKIIKGVLEAFAAGAMTYAEMRGELALSTDDVDGVIDEWREDRVKLGLPETPQEGNGGPPGGKDEDDDDDDDDDGKNKKDDE